MFEVIFLLALGLIWIIAATVQDMRTKEVANWLNFSLIIFALGFRFFYSMFSDAGFSLFYQGLIGLAIFFALGNILYYSKVFSGGDAKLMIALGTILPVSSSFYSNLHYFVFFVFIFFLVGTIYGLISSIIIMFKNLKEFRKKFKEIFGKNKKIIFLAMFLGLFFMIIGFSFILFSFIGVMAFLFPYIFLYAKAIEESSMVQKIKTSGLREGDWLYSSVKIGKSYIEPNWGGLNMKQIKDIRKKYNFVKIKQGIVFIPVFLISFFLFSYGILLGIRILSFVFSGSF